MYFVLHVIFMDVWINWNVKGHQHCVFFLLHHSQTKQVAVFGITFRSRTRIAKSTEQLENWSWLVKFRKPFVNWFSPLMAGEILVHSWPVQGVKLSSSIEWERYHAINRITSDKHCEYYTKPCRGCPSPGLFNKTSTKIYLRWLVIVCSFTHKRIKAYIFYFKSTLWKFCLALNSNTRRVLVKIFERSQNTV